MNSDIAQGKWKQLKGSIQEKWGDITDDDFDRLEGSRERLVGLIQEKYGKQKDEAKREVDRYFDSIN